MIGEGSYGMVFKARCKISGKTYAMKQVKMADGIPFPQTALREVNILRSLHHENVIHVHEMLIGSTLGKFFMAMELAHTDLA